MRQGNENFFPKAKNELERTTSMHMTEYPFTEHREHALLLLSRASSSILSTITGRCIRMQHCLQTFFRVAQLAKPFFHVLSYRIGHLFGSILDFQV